MDIKINGIYKHFKGDLYIVEDIAINSDTLNKYVIYRALYGDNLLYVRDLDDFMSDVDKNKYPDVEQTKRFQLMNIESVRK